MNNEQPPVRTRRLEQTAAAVQVAINLAVESPSLDYLDHLASLERDEDNRAHVDASPWTCFDTFCGTHHDVIKNCLVDLPYPRCTNCGTPNPASYDYRITDISVCDVNLDVPVFNQGARSTCTQYACATVAFLCAKLEITRYAHAPAYTAPLDMNKFVRYFRRCYYHEDATGSTIPLTLNYIYEFGIPIRNAVGSALPPVGREFNLRIGGYFQVDPSDTDYLTRLIASGFPLVGLIEAGRRFKYISGREIYVTPQQGTEPGLCHTVALIGSGLQLRNVRRPNSRRMHAVYETYFVIRDSYGPYAHGSSARSFAHDGVAVGYDFNVWASDLREAWGVWNSQGCKFIYF